MVSRAVSGVGSIRLTALSRFKAQDQAHKQLAEPVDRHAIGITLLLNCRRTAGSRGAPLVPAQAPGLTASAADQAEALQIIGSTSKQHGCRRHRRTSPHWRDELAWTIAALPICDSGRRWPSLNSINRPRRRSSSRPLHIPVGPSQPDQDLFCTAVAVPLPKCLDSCLKRFHLVELGDRPCPRACIASVMPRPSRSFTNLSQSI